jgi:cell wall-associated protease
MKKTLILLLIPFWSHAQNLEGWHHLDPVDDGVLGISTNKSYEYLKGKKADTVIVAIIDNGAELTHEDLQGAFWVNTKEIPNNGIDDDNNGFIDDINGWNFIGNPNGENLKKETTGLTRLYGLLSEKYGNNKEFIADSLTIEGYNLYLKIKVEYEAEVEGKKKEILQYDWILNKYKASEIILIQQLKKSDFTLEEVKGMKSKKDEVKEAKEFYLKVHSYNLNEPEITKRLKNLNDELDTRLNPHFKNREEIVGDNPDDINDSIYGNNMLNVKGPFHGTGVASVVGALQNGVGVDGICSHVKLMIIRIVPNGDERDKDIALAIKYAIRNGAQIINMSFAKKYSLHNEFVIEAVKEAEQANVLLVQGAGNNMNNNDETPYYPTGKDDAGTKFSNWLIVGASCSKDDEKLIAFFSNYGKKSVDVFAPGFQIKNCELNNGYGYGSGTSISSPVVAGLAAVLLSYYPHLTAKELKEIIIKSAYKPITPTLELPNSNEKVTLDDVSVSGGIANLYNAILLIEKEYLR